VLQETDVQQRRRNTRQPHLRRSPTHPRRPKTRRNEHSEARPAKALSGEAKASQTAPENVRPTSADAISPSASPR
jgi:hypothetical protein